MTICLAILYQCYFFFVCLSVLDNETMWFHLFRCVSPLQFATCISLSCSHCSLVLWGFHWLYLLFGLFSSPSRVCRGYAVLHRCSRFFGQTDVILLCATVHMHGRVCRGYAVLHCVECLFHPWLSDGKLRCYFLILDNIKPHYLFQVLCFILDLENKVQVQCVLRNCKLACIIRNGFAIL